MGFEHCREVGFGKKILAWNRLLLANGIRNLIVPLEVAMDSVHRLVDSLDRGAQANAERILPLELLVRQLQCLLHKWEMIGVRAVSCTSLHYGFANCNSF